VRKQKAVACLWNTRYSLRGEIKTKLSTSLDEITAVLFVSFSRLITKVDSRSFTSVCGKLNFST
jgi:hypothetical protein